MTALQAHSVALEETFDLLAVVPRSGCKAAESASARACHCSSPRLTCRSRSIPSCVPFNFPSQLGSSNLGHRTSNHRESRRRLKEGSKDPPLQAHRSMVPRVGDEKDGVGRGLQGGRLVQRPEARQWGWPGLGFLPPCWQSDRCSAACARIYM